MNARTAPQSPVRRSPRRATRKTVLKTLSAVLCVSRTPTRPGAPLRIDAPDLATAFGITTPPHPDTIPPHLTQLVPLLAQCLNRNQIAAQLHITRYSVDSRIQRLYRLLGAHNRVQAVRIAHEIGILPTIGGPR